MIVAFGHRKRVGKDTAAKFLDTFLKVERPGLKVKKISFASKLKDVAFQLYGWAGLQRGVFYETEAGEKLREVILPKLNKHPRQLWIEVGNKCREIYQDTWIDNALNQAEADVIILTDMRFQNEARKIRELGVTNYLCRIDRDDVLKGDDPAEVDLIPWTDWDEVLVNNGSMKELSEKIAVLGRHVLDTIRT